MKENINKYADLYGWDVTVRMLKKKFNLVSYAENSIPTAGSLTFSSDRLNVNGGFIIDRAINHRNGDVTIITNQGWLKFTN